MWHSPPFDAVISYIEYSVDDLSQVDGTWTPYFRGSRKEIFDVVPLRVIEIGGICLAKHGHQP